MQGPFYQLSIIIFSNLASKLTILMLLQEEQADKNDQYFDNK